ncbi:hypothetical protein AT726_05850 [Turicibacter sp. H121]|nr:hypothetical protein AT726_05850 [Turicibacter sp. H121]
MESRQVGFATPSIMVPAIAYYSGGRIWYAMTIPFSQLRGGLIKTSTIKKKGQEIIKSEIKNRFLDKAHKDDIKKYMEEEKRYTIPPVTLVSLERLPFEPILFGGTGNEINSIEELYETLKVVGSMGGVIQLPLDYQFECLDGNHRSVAIRELAEENPEITQGSNLLLNIVCEDDILKIRQDFVDVNKNVKQTTPSINTLFNTRDPLPHLVSVTLNQFKYLETITDLLNTSVSKNSYDLYTLNNLKNALIELCGFDSQVGKSAEAKANKYLSDEINKHNVKVKADLFFTYLQRNYFIKQCLENKSLVMMNRSSSIITTGIGLSIMSYLANCIFDLYQDSNLREDQLIKLMNYDWSRNNPIFLKSGIVTNSYSIVNSRTTISQTKQLLKEDLGI